MMVAFLLLNGLVQVLRDEWLWLTGFYGLEAQLARPQFDFRTTGIFENPNTAALSMTVLYLYVISGLRRGLVRPNTALVVTALWAALAMATLMISRNQILAILLASVALPFYLPKRVAVRSFGLGIVLVAITAAVIWGVGTESDRCSVSISGNRSRIS